MATNAERKSFETPIFCDRCLNRLSPGRGDFYQIKIEAVADPYPPVISEKDMQSDLRKQIEDTIARLQVLSEQEAKDQVYRRLTLFLCLPCYTTWIENPTG